jgi:hypothetical protein
MARGGSGGVRVRIEAETSGLRAGVDQAAGILHGFEQGSSRAARGAKHFADAISGITGAAGGATGAISTLLGGFAVGGIAGAAIGGVHALVTAIGDIREESAKAAKEAAEHAAEIAKKMGEAALAVQRARFVAAGGNAADFDKVVAQRAVLADPRMAGPYAREMKAAAERELAAFEAIERQKVEAVRQAEAWIANIRKGASLQVERTTEDATEKATRAAQARWEAENRYIEQADAHVRAYYAHQEQMMRDLAAGAGSSGFEEEGARSAEYYALQLRDAAAAQTLLDQQTEQSAATAQQWGQTLGTVVAQLAADQITAGQAIAQIGQTVVASVVQSAIAQITANAATAASGAAASQAPVPVIGPVLAISAMGAMLSAVLGLLGSLPARRYGGDVLAGMPYLVGEAGPEVIVPGMSGTVIPNDRLRGGAGGGGITINVAGMIDRGNLRRTLIANDGELAAAQRSMARRRRG